MKKFLQKWFGEYYLGIPFIALIVYGLLKLLQCK